MTRGRVRFSDIADDVSLRVVTAQDVPPTSAPLEDLAHNPDNPRENYNDIDELAKSLAEAGQLQAITAVPRNVFLAHFPQHERAIGEAPWVVISGNRRLAAAKKAGLRELRMIVQDRLGDADRIPEAALIENIHRQALPPLLEARELQALVERHGSQSKLAKRLSKSQAWISQRLALLKLAPELQEELKAGSLTVEEGRAIASEPPERQRAALELLRRNSHRSSRRGRGRATRGPALSRRGDLRHGPVRLDSVEHAAEDLRRCLPADDVRKLAQLLLEAE